MAWSGYPPDRLLIGCGFEFGGTAVAEGGVEPGAVVPADVSDDGAAGCGPAWKGLITHRYGLNRSEPSGITAGPDGAVWFTEFIGNQIGRITTSGVITNEFPITATPNSEPFDITAGPDGNLWFTEFHGNKVGRITTSGIITEFGLPTTCPPSSLGCL